jgi:predicted ATP-dependent protease
MIPELRPEDLRWVCNEDECDFQSTADVEPLHRIVGQDRALSAIELGLHVRQPGYNVFVSGIPGSGRNTSVRLYLEELAPALPSPNDWCYVRNFAEEFRPRAIELPNGTAPSFARQVESAVGHAVDAVRGVLDGAQHTARREELAKTSAAERQRLTSAVDEQAKKWGFAIVTSQTGIDPVKVGPDGQPLTPEQYGALPESEREEAEKRAEELRGLIGRTFLQIRRIDRDFIEASREIDMSAAAEVVETDFSELRQRASVLDQAEFAAYLDSLQADLLDQLNEIRSFDEPAEGQKPPDPQGRRERFLVRYKVNVFVTNDSSGAPVIFQNTGSYYDVFGRADYRSVGGAMVTDHTMIQPGALHRANGGFLILQAADVFGARPDTIWEALKRALRSGEIRIEALGEQFRAVPTQSLNPESIPLSAKVIIIGTPGIYQLAWSADEDFRKLFKVKADFATDMERTPASINHLASFVRRRCDSESLPPFDRGAIARVIEYAARLAGNQEKLSARFVDLAEIVTEAAYWAGRRDGASHVTRSDVSTAIEQKLYRASLHEDRLQQMIEDGTIRIAVTGEAVGQVNGMSVYEVADHSFGRPTRITARVALGEGEFINLERETELSGPIHSKGFLALVGYLEGKYGSERPLALSARISFEQLYNEVEGDSASSAELCALLSALAELPVRQGIAVTGAVNQLGDVQAVGGVVEKVEGFFDVCRAIGLDGRQGVIIPAANRRNLMLNDAVVDAVATKEFHIWAVAHVDEGLEILTGMPAGKADRNGRFPRQSVHGRALARLEWLLEKRQFYAAQLEAEHKTQPRVEAAPERRRKR